MSTVQADASAIIEAWNNVTKAATSIEQTKSSINRKYQQLGTGWNDRTYKELGDVIGECSRALNNVRKTLLQGEKALALFVKSIQEYESISIGGHSPASGPTRHLSDEEVNNRWQSEVENISEMIETYRSELLAHGVCAGSLLEKFLAGQRAKMLKYEGEVLNAASGRRQPLSEDEVYHYVIVGENSPYNYSWLVHEFGDFCLEQIDSWVHNINPNPNHSPLRNVNCGQCAAAVYRRINGDDLAIAGLGTYSIEEMNEITGRRQTPMTPAQIENHLRTQGAGAHVVVGVDRATGSGHWFNAFFDGRQVYTIDGQDGSIEGWPPDYGQVVNWDASI